MRLPLHTSGYFLTILYFRLQINIKVLDHHHAGISRTPLRSEYVDPGNRVFSINKLYSKYTEAYSKFINIPKVWGVRIAKNVTSCSISYDPNCLNYLITIVCVPAIWSVAVTSGGIFTQDNIISSQALHFSFNPENRTRDLVAERTPTRLYGQLLGFTYVNTYIHFILQSTMTARLPQTSSIPHPKSTWYLLHSIQQE